jgi:hypothetical protein
VLGDEVDAVQLAAFGVLVDAGLHSPNVLPECAEHTEFLGRGYKNAFHFVAESSLSA